MTPVDRPTTAEYASFYAGYVAHVPDGALQHVLRQGSDDLAAALAAVPEEFGGYRYASGKWSVREVLGHMIDTERIMSYRLLRIGRGDITPLPGFEENDYVQTAGSDGRTLADLRREMDLVRASTLCLVDSLPGEAWTRMGTASGQPISARALVYIVAGHFRHHLAILRDRYLSQR